VVSACFIEISIVSVTGKKVNQKVVPRGKDSVLYHLVVKVRERLETHGQDPDPGPISQGHVLRLLLGRAVHPVPDHVADRVLDRAVHLAPGRAVDQAHDLAVCLAHDHTVLPDLARAVHLAHGHVVLPDPVRAADLILVLGLDHRHGQLQDQDPRQEIVLAASPDRQADLGLHLDRAVGQGHRAGQSLDHHRDLDQKPIQMMKQ